MLNNKTPTIEYPFLCITKIFPYHRLERVSTTTKHQFVLTFALIFSQLKVYILHTLVSTQFTEAVKVDQCNLSSCVEVYM